MTQIARIEIYQVTLPLAEPFRIAVGVMRQVETIVVRLIDASKFEGWGEAAPHPQILSSTCATCRAALEWMAPRLLGQDIRSPMCMATELKHMLSGNSAAKAALDIALHDLIGRRMKLPLWQLLGGAQTDNNIPTACSLGIAEPEEVLEKAKSAVQAGFQTIKVKVGIDPQRDIETVRLLRFNLGNNIAIIVDANQGWNRQQAVDALNQMAKFNVAIAEQPVAADDYEGMAWIRTKTSIPVMADESVHSPSDVVRIIRSRAADYINIKLMKSGGLYNAMRIATIAEAACIPCMIGAMSETNLAITAAVHLAAAHRNIVFTDLEIGAREDLRLIEEGGITAVHGALRLADPIAAGLGIRCMNHEKLGEPVCVFQI